MYLTSNHLFKCFIQLWNVSLWSRGSMYHSDTENPLNLERNGSENSVNLAVCSFKEIEKSQVMIFLVILTESLLNLNML